MLICPLSCETKERQFFGVFPLIGEGMSGSRLIQLRTRLEIWQISGKQSCDAMFLTARREIVWGRKETK